MFRISLIISISCICSSLGKVLTMSDEDYRLLPPIYRMDNFSQCVRRKNIYCIADIKLDSSYKNSTSWKLIEETKRQKLLYNHDTIHRTICVPKMYESMPEEIKNFTTIFVGKEIEKLNLTPTIVNISCNQAATARTTDHIIMFLICSYFILIFSATLYDLLIRRTNGAGRGNRILIAFSLGSNYEKIFVQNRGKNYQKLKCIQGLRTLSSVVTIWYHTKVSYMVFFVRDTKYIEDMYELWYTCIIFDMFVMQIFILISGWLLTIQVLDIFEANKKFTLKDAILLLINRWFRFWPALLFAMSLQRRVFVQEMVGIPLPDFLDATDRACQNYWWASLLFVQNHLNVKDMCFGPAWYLSNDIQLYVISLMILYAMLKFKSVKSLLVFCLIISYALFGFIIYFNDLDVVFRTSPEAYKWKNFFHDLSFVYLYTMTHVNSTTYILGICFGIFYYRQQNSQVFSKKIFLPIWNLSLFGLPALAVAIASREFKGLSAALVGPLLKPMFSLGIGMGILEMSQSRGGIIKRLLEWKPLEFLSQFTFCAFMYNVFVIFPRSSITEEPLHISHVILITSAVQDAVCGFLIAFVMYLLVELPFRNLQKIYLPQIRKGTVKTE